MKRFTHLSSNIRFSASLFSSQFCRSFNSPRRDVTWALRASLSFVSYKHKDDDPSSQTTANAAQHRKKWHLPVCLNLYLNKVLFFLFEQSLSSVPLSRVLLKTVQLLLKFPVPTSHKDRNPINHTSYCSSPPNVLPFVFGHINSILIISIFYIF